MDDDTISRKAAIDAINRAVTKEAARWSLQELPSAERRGRWIAYKRHVAGEPYIAFDESGEPFIQRPQIEVTRYKCPFCGEIEDIATPYCCECGARMEGEEE